MGVIAVKMMWSGSDLIERYLRIDLKEMKKVNWAAVHGSEGRAF